MASRMNAVMNIFFFLWELPQNVLGIAYLLVKTARGSVISRSYERDRLFVKVRHGAVSLGYFVFWSDTGDPVFSIDERNRLHEYGHTLQSRFLGPLYLPVVGIPSVSRVIYAHWYYRKHKKEW